jgi:hypothetical protein
MTRDDGMRNPEHDYRNSMLDAGCWMLDPPPAREEGVVTAHALKPPSPRAVTAAAFQETRHGET